MNEAEASAQQFLCDYILASGHDDWVHVASVWSRASRELLGDSVADRVQLVVNTVRTLLADGL